MSKTKLIKPCMKSIPHNIPYRLIFLRLMPSAENSRKLWARPPCDGTPSASVWPLPGQSPGWPHQYPSLRPPHDAIRKHAGGPSVWPRPSDEDKTRFDERGPLKEVASKARRSAVGAFELCKCLSHPSLPQYQSIGLFCQRYPNIR